VKAFAIALLAVGAVLAVLLLALRWLIIGVDAE
jgi:hypothetical protein